MFDSVVFPYIPIIEMYTLTLCKCQKSEWIFKKIKKKKKKKKRNRCIEVLVSKTWIFLTVLHTVQLDLPRLFFVIYFSSAS